jgi:fused signal recognition particle receptor
MALFSKIFNKLRSAISTSSADWDELRTTLIEADLGAQFAESLIEIAQREKADNLEAALTTALKNAMTTSSRELAFHSDRPTIIMVVGVNGTGKTTSVAKLMKNIIDRNRTVIVAAADTFRAAAIEQLQTWGQRLGVPVVSGKFQGDPAAVVFDAVAQVKSAGSDYLIIDTAGRLHTQSNLMDELAKIRRVAAKSAAPHDVDEVLLVVDATTGQNGIVQAKSFIESVGVTGLILTKLDGSAKGGIALAIERETGIPIKFVGTGESASDFAPFDQQSYIQGLLADPGE